MYHNLFIHLSVTCHFSCFHLLTVVTSAAISVYVHILYLFENQLLGRSPGEGNGNPLRYSCLENPVDG